MADRIGVGSLFPPQTLEDLYLGETEEDFVLGKRAKSLYRRIAQCLNTDFLLPIRDIRQWTEERSVNHHLYARTPKWPVGLIIVSGGDYIRSTKTLDFMQKIMEYPEFNKLNLEIILAANSSGGLKKDSIEEYEFSVKSNEETKFRNYQEAIMAIEKAYHDKKELRTVGGRNVDLVRLYGFDSEISGGALYIDIGNRPALRKEPPSRNLNPVKWFKPQTTSYIHTIPPKRSISILEAA